MTDGLLEQHVRIADRQARAKFFYKAERGDTWRSFADDVLADRHWQGDCDDLASTALDLVVRSYPDADQSQLFRLCVATPECPRWEAYDHMVAAVILGGQLYCFGDTMGRPARPSERDYKVAQYARLSEGVTWREGAPLA